MKKLFLTLFIICALLSPSCAQTSGSNALKETEIMQNDELESSSTPIYLLNLETTVPQNARKRVFPEFSLSYNY